MMARLAVIASSDSVLSSTRAPKRATATMSLKERAPTPTVTRVVFVMLSLERDPAVKESHSRGKVSGIPDNHRTAGHHGHSSCGTGHAADREVPCRAQRTRARIDHHPRPGPAPIIRLPPVAGDAG